MLLGWLLHRSMHVFMAGDADAAPLGRAPAMLLALLALLPMLPCDAAAACMLPKLPQKLARSS
jgi:hypothetical protein